MPDFKKLICNPEKIVTFGRYAEELLNDSNFISNYHQNIINNACEYGMEDKDLENLYILSSKK